jgi:hypothetical protein
MSLRSNSDFGSIYRRFPVVIAVQLARNFRPPEGQLMTLLYRPRLPHRSPHRRLILKRWFGRSFGPREISSGPGNLSKTSWSFHRTTRGLIPESWRNHHHVLSSCWGIGSNIFLPRIGYARAHGRRRAHPHVPGCPARTLSPSSLAGRCGHARRSTGNLRERSDRRDLRSPLARTGQQALSRMVATTSCSPSVKSSPTK